MKVYRGAAAAARHYVEADRSRADDYYLAEGNGIAMRMVGGLDKLDQQVRVEHRADMDGETYERWVAGYEVDTGAAKGRLRTDDKGVRFVEVTVNGPKTWSAGSPRTRRPASVHAIARCRSRSNRARPPSYVTSPPAPETRTGTCISRSTPGSSRPARGEDSTPSGSATAWRRSTGSGTRP